jgi:hypothetical protein
MLLTKPQQLRFWREWSRAKAHQDWDPATAELERKELLKRAGFQSLTHVDRGPGFDALLAELGRLQDHVGRTIEVQNPEPGLRRRYLHVLRKDAHDLGGEPYILAIARDKFGLTQGLRTIEDLDTTQLRQLMITIHARAHKRHDTLRSQSLDSEEQFPDETEFAYAGHENDDNQPF